MTVTTTERATTTTARYPSMLLPAAPPFSIAVPAGFIAHAAPGALAMVRPAEASGDAHTPTVAVSSALVQAGSDPVEVLTAALGHHADGTITTAPVATAHGTATATLARRQGRHAVTQRVTAHVLPTAYAGGVTHAMTVVSTWTDTETRAADLRRIHDSFTVAG